MEPRIIKTNDQYRHFRAEVEELALPDPDPESPEGLRLELLAKLVEDYEKVRFAFAKPDPIDAIIFRMEQQGLRQKDIAPLLGGKNRASEVLSRKRSLTLPMIRALHTKLDIPLGLLVREPDAAYTTSSPAKRPIKKAPRARPDVGPRGFDGFMPLGLVRSRLLEIPAECGVYVVVQSEKSAPAFLASGEAGWFQGRDPSYPIDVLQRKWVPGAGILYVGKAGPASGRTLRKRISELVRFGSGEPVSHRGGRALWQLTEIWDARIAWKVTAGDPLDAERALLAKFERDFGRLPFANFRR